MFDSILEWLKTIKEFLSGNKKIALYISVGVMILAVTFVLFINHGSKVKNTAPEGNKSIIETPVKMSNELVIMSQELAKDLGMLPQNNKQNNAGEANSPKATGVLSLEDIDNILRAKLKGTQDEGEETVNNANNNSSVGQTTGNGGDYYNKQDEYIKQLLTSENGVISRYMVIKLIEIRNFLTVNILNSGFYSIKSYAETGKSKYGTPIDINIFMARMGTVMERKRGYDELFSLVEGRELKEIASVWYKVSKQIDVKYSEVINNPPVVGKPYNLDLKGLEASIQEFYAVLDKYGIHL